MPSVAYLTNVRVNMHQLRIAAVFPSLLNAARHEPISHGLAAPASIEILTSIARDLVRFVQNLQLFRQTGLGTEL